MAQSAQRARSLQEMRGVRRDFLTDDAVGHDLTALAKEHESPSAVPVPDHVQARVYLTAIGLGPQIPTQKHCLDGPAQSSAKAL